jgi:hypothetical protein
MLDPVGGIRSRFISQFKMEGEMGGAEGEKGGEERKG